MPMYEFECDSCGNLREAIVKFEEVVECDVCECPMRKKVSRIGFFDLQGGGWAKDSYNSNKNEG